MITFKLNDVEQKNAKMWANKHNKKCLLANYKYTFDSSGGIGTSVLMTCCTCNEEHDITDYNAW